MTTNTKELTDEQRDIISELITYTGFIDAAANKQTGDAYCGLVEKIRSEFTRLSIESKLKTLLDGSEMVFARKHVWSYPESHYRTTYTLKLIDDSGKFVTE